MYRNSLVMKMILTFAAFSAVVVFLNYVVGMPTTKRMNFVLMSYGVGSATILALAAVFPSRLTSALCRLVQIGWGIAVLVGGLSMITIIVVGLGQFNLPFLSLQWYSLFMALGILGASVFTLVNDSYFEVVESCENTAGKPKVASSPASSSSPSSGAAY